MSSADRTHLDKRTSVPDHGAADWRTAGIRRHVEDLSAGGNAALESGVFFEMGATLPDAAPHPAPALENPLPGVDDAEGARVPEGLPPVVDAHVHVFPEPLFEAVWAWFARHGWPIRYRLHAPQLVEFLQARGVDRLVALHYAHKPGVARELNRFVAQLVRRYPQVTGMATVFPGEDGDETILREAFDLGLAGVKLHSHVQCFDMQSPGMHRIYALCARLGKPLIMHVGREPKSPAYACDPYALCDSRRLEAVLRGYPELRICVPHLGADEYAEYQRLIEDHENLWLDTTMALARYLPLPDPPALEDLRADRIMFGSDLPNIPYAWDRELRHLAAMGLAQDRLTRLLSTNAGEFYGIDLPPAVEQHAPVERI